MLYRIFTEDKNKQGIEKIVSRYYPGYTIIKAQGHWKLIKEGSLIIEVTDPKTTRRTINKMAGDIKELNAQESVLVQELKNANWLI